MAGEWLKFDSTLPEKQETLAITVAMGWDDADLTVGKLMRLFRWFDQHTVDGNAASVTPALLDRIVGVSGFVSAVAAQGWLIVSDGGICLNHFEYHNGASAKSRALTAKRVANHKSNGKANAEGNAESVSGALPRVEKSREDKKNTKEKKSAAAPTPCPEDVNAQVWDDWLQLRKKKSAPVTTTVINEARAESQKAGLSLERFLSIWCARGSQGLQADWLRPNERGGTTANTHKFAAAAKTIFGDDSADERRTIDA